MSERMLMNRIKKYKDLEVRKAAIEKEMEDLKADLLADMQEKGLEEQRAGNWVIRWTKVITNRLDSKALKAELPELAARFTRQTESRRFSIIKKLSLCQCAT